MAGGSGTRFWPKSTSKKPKQFLNLTGEGSLIELTARRFQGIVDPSQVRISTTKELSDSVLRALPKCSSQQLILEPMAKNTAPCIGLSAVKLLSEDPEALMVVLPSDHLIKNVEGFKKVILDSVSYVQASSRILTIGIEPTYAETGFGYIRSGDRDPNATKGIEIFNVAEFVEKPNRERAEEYLKTKLYYWNAGIFVFKAKTILEEFRMHLPKTHEVLLKIQSLFSEKSQEQRVRELFSTLEPVSIDYGIMEKSNCVSVFPARGLGWSDVGSWLAMEEISPKVSGGVSNRPDVISIDSSGNIIDSDLGCVALIGIENLIVIRTGESLLICQKDRAQDIKKIVEELKAKKRLDLL